MENNEVTFLTKVAHADRVISEFAALVLTSTAKYAPDNDSDEDNNIGLIARQTCLQRTVGALLTDSVDASSAEDLVGALMAGSVDAFLPGSAAALSAGALSAGSVVCS
ncbi:hypothetical protein BZA05DRAFT_440132 [Tricharina praecox]|uniref:uncharacterized protein n=1 Tax=Tricharina praecox TaxID=43433 RepID=UPI0022211F62|nr:uncharacterized protein BZA05DRAFT_440132 [Tricharina praecox]KAI5858476.1 hypothetical protein BZA05DRAFT_440132 [Tricharina praecox]